MSEVKFFNYHEYVNVENPDKCVTEFPNPYVPRTSELFSTSCIVRVPRIYTESDVSNSIPQFSHFFPGKEPAAYVASSDSPLSSRSRLADYLTETQFHDIVATVNKYLSDAYNPWSARNMTRNILGHLTFWVADWFISSNEKLKLAQLEDYVKSVNDSFVEPLSLISPRRSAYLSLDFQVPLSRAGDSSG